MRPLLHLAANACMQIYHLVGESEFWRTFRVSQSLGSLIIEARASGLGFRGWKFTVDDMIEGGGGGGSGGDDGSDENFVDNGEVETTMVDDDDVGVGVGGMMSDEVEVDEMADKELSSVGWRWCSWWGGPGNGTVVVGSSDGEGPITSFTIPLKSTWLFCLNMGSANPGGGHTSSLKIEPVSDVRDFIKLRLV